MKIYEIKDNIPLISEYINNNEEIKGFSKDTRTIAVGEVYVAIKGESFDGNDFIIDAYKNGAVLAISDNPNDEIISYVKENKKNLIIVEDSIKALQELAIYKRNLYDIPVVAITGSAGKTSTKDMVANVLAQKYKVLKTPGNLNNHIGLPLTILSLDDHEVLVVEMGMNHFGELSLLSKIAKPTIALITNVGTAHIGILGSRENILKAKLEILDGLCAGGQVILNYDNDLLNKEAINLKNIITYGINNKSDFQGKDIKLEALTSSFKYNDEEISLNISGEHFIYNALAAIAVGTTLKVPIEDIKKGLLTFQISSNRMQIIKTTKYTLIDDSYNANYDAVIYCLKYLNSLNKRKIAVLGDMLELGEHSIKLHQKVGEKINELNLDLVVTVGNDSLNINKKITNTLNYHFDNNKDTINFLKETLHKGDYVLIKASHGLNFKEIVEELKINE
ncbi:MAG: UDP-N-acetylmuramoyl-tripeptide--D-alanyl-D-alanine ligase [Bacilli bacterium]|nr:UDP-N-acetylmuramoyl-tripeptide--D-alanyl-D-alanine ligase [Bacilli bacterium]